MNKVKFKFYPQVSEELLEIWDVQTGEIVEINEPSEVEEFLDWNTTDMYTFEWTDGEDVLGLFC